jgi:hypothetical protein
MHFYPFPLWSPLTWIHSCVQVSTTVTWTKTHQSKNWTLGYPYKREHTVFVRAWATSHIVFFFSSSTHFLKILSFLYGWIKFYYVYISHFLKTFYFIFYLFTLYPTHCSAPDHCPHNPSPIYPLPPFPLSRWGCPLGTPNSGTSSLFEARRFLSCWGQARHPS